MLLILTLAIALFVLCVVHIIKTDQERWWVYFVLSCPIGGAIVYIIAVMLPELFDSRAARKAIRDVGRAADPVGEFRELVGRAGAFDTLENKLTLARACLKRERNDAAVSLLEDCLDAGHEDDIAVLTTLAQARFAQEDYPETRAVLDHLREAHPDLSCPEGHLLYASSLEAEGEAEQALMEYEALVGYFPGEEARCRYGLLLRKLGHVEQSRSTFEDVKRSVERAGKAYFRSEKDWYEMAKGNLA